MQPSYGLNDTEIERMLEESIEYAEEDFAERQLIEARNEAENMLHVTEKALASEAAAELDNEERNRIVAGVSLLRAAMEGKDYKLVRARIDELNRVSMHLAELMMNRALEMAVQGKRLDQV